MVVVGRFICNFQESDYLPTIHNRHNQDLGYRNMALGYIQAFIRIKALLLFEGPAPDTAPFLARIYYRLVGNLALFPDIPCHRRDNQPFMFIYVSKDAVLAFHGFQKYIQHFPVYFVVRNGKEDFYDVVPNAQLPLRFPQRLFGLLTLGDVVLG